MPEFLDPEKVLKQLKIRKNMVAADFGCGSGGWVIPLAKKLEEGKIFAIDILEEPLSALRAKIKLEKLINVEIVRADIEKTSKLFANSCDLVLMTNLLFEAEDAKKILEEGKRVLKKGGMILVVDWKEDSAFGPDKKISAASIKRFAQEIDLKLEKEFEAGTYHWGLLFIK